MDINSKTIFTYSMIGMTKSYSGYDIKIMMKNRIKLMNRKGFDAPLYDDFYNTYINGKDGYQLNKNSYYYIITKKKKGETLATLKPIKDYNKSPMRKYNKIIM